MTDIAARLRLGADTLEQDMMSWQQNIEATLMRQAADEIDRLRAKLAWQPIESAPKDGTPIDLWATAWANSDEGYQRYPAARWRVTHLGGAWTSHSNTVTLRPTHWKPLPEPPDLRKP